MMVHKHQTETRVARSIAEVETLREFWTSWPGHRDSDIDVFLAIVKSLPEVLRPHVVVQYRDGRPVSLLAGRMELKQLSFKLGYLTLFRFRARCLTFVYGAIHGSASPEDTEVLLRGAMNSLKHNEADLAMFELVPLSSPLYRLALSLPGIFGRDTLPAPQGRDSLTIPGGIDDIYREMSRDRRKHIKASIKKLEASPLGELRIACYRDPADLDQLFRDAEAIAMKTYQRGLGVGFAANSITRARLELGAQKGWLRAFVLYLGDRPCAFWIGMLYHGTFVSEFMGYDPELSRYSPGTVLAMRVLEEFCNGANGDIVTNLDFGPGQAEYKKMLASQSWLEAVLFIFAPTPRGFLLKLMRLTSRSLDLAARRVLASTSLGPKLKKAWRRRLSNPNAAPATSDSNSAVYETREKSLTSA